MNLKVSGAILPLGCAILSTRAKLLRGLLQPPLGELGLSMFCALRQSSFLENLFFDT